MGVLIFGLGFTIFFAAICLAVNWEHDGEKYCPHCGYNVKDLPRYPECGKLTDPRSG